MSNFTVRVYVHNEVAGNMAELNGIMVSYGFRLTISSDVGTIYVLPPGEYSYTGNIDRKAVLEMVKAAAGQVGKKYSIFITESKGRTWYNLTKAPKVP
ncbi:type V toxin-antitoxin system endoribonuclease antitoxin GhoS [Variovorax paradoxus]|uniref:type V toxin-antitoxin system endoribonuclease antitoxin GhoS n=1 Tax=Variovorax paradoxus TaxID=34073 RepID=UPI0012D4A9DE|nr:type V toxin-antitoxin system endoribonuclease antitoxin GhoS [Variovorax paradoxus]